MADKKEPIEAKKPKVDVAKWKARKLKAINKMADKAKAKALAERINRY